MKKKLFGQQFENDPCANLRKLCTSGDAEKAGRRCQHEGKAGLLTLFQTEGMNCTGPRETSPTIHAFPTHETLTVKLE